MNVKQGKPCRFVPEQLLAEQQALIAKEKMDYFSLHHQYSNEGALPATELVEDLANALGRSDEWNNGSEV